MDQIKEILPFIIPLLILQLVLLVLALVDIFKRDEYKIGNRLMWVIISIVVNIIGPILYFVLGRGEKRE